MPITLTPTGETIAGKPVYSYPAKGIINKESGFKPKLLCDGPTFSFGAACVYGCRYCYVEPIMHKLLSAELARLGLTHDQVVIRREGGLDVMRAQLLPRGKPKYKGGDNVGKVIYASPLVDVAATLELARETVAACKLILEHTDWHIRLLSKSSFLPLVAKSLLNASVFVTSGISHQDVYNRMIFGVSTGTLDNDLAKAIEPGTALVSKRLESLYWLQDNGFRTYGMICPSTPHLDYYQFAREMFDAIRADKCEHVWAEVMNVRGTQLDDTAKAMTEAGYVREAENLRAVIADKRDWEKYSRVTFLGHQRLYGAAADGGPKLRFLQYVTNETRPWWERYQEKGAVLL